MEPCCERDHNRDGNCDRHPAKPLEGCMFVNVAGKREQRRIVIRDGRPSPETRSGEHLSEMIGGGFFITTVRAE